MLICECWYCHLPKTAYKSLWLSAFSHSGYQRLQLAHPSDGASTIPDLFSQSRWLLVPRARTSRCTSCASKSGSSLACTSAIAASSSRAMRTLALAKLTALSGLAGSTSSVNLWTAHCFTYVCAVCWYRSKVSVKWVVDPLVLPGRLPREVLVLQSDDEGNACHADLRTNNRRVNRG